MERIVFLTNFFGGLIFFIFIDNQVCNDDFQSIKWPVLVKCLLYILAQVLEKIPTIVDFKRLTILWLTNIAPPKDLETVSPRFNIYYSSKSFWIKMEYPGTYTVMSLWHDHMLLCAIRELKHATFLSHGRQPEVNISHDRTVAVSQIFKIIVSASENILNNINVVVWRQVKYENSALPVAVRGSKTLHA